MLTPFLNTYLHNKKESKKYLESALKEKGYDDVTIKDFVNYVKDDINGVKPFVRVK